MVVIDIGFFFVLGIVAYKMGYDGIVPVLSALSGYVSKRIPHVIKKRKQKKNETSHLSN